MKARNIKIIASFILKYLLVAFVGLYVGYWLRVLLFLVTNY